ncbi:MAG: hypothetical protein H5T98_09445, partial [Syntrophomonadaceae bacterium]|nr:hypothetical protein [Syntrophomonadaceae bacterium]
MGLLTDFLQTPEGIGLLSVAAGAMTGARRGEPWNTAGRGLTAGLMGYAGAQELARNEKKSAVEERFKALQMGQLQRQIEQQKAQDAWRAGLPGIMNNAQPKVEQFQPDDPFNQGASAFGEGVGGQQVGSGMVNVQPGNPQALQDYLLQPGSPFADKLIEYQLMPKREEYGTTPFIDAEGNAQLIGKTGKTKTLPFRGAPKEGANPYGQDLREWFAVNQIDPRTATPEQLRAGYAAVNQTKDKRAAAGGVNIGQLGPKYTEGVDKLGAQYLFEQFGEARNAATAVSAVNDAKVLLDQGMFTGKAGPWQESVAGWYQAATGRPIPKL